MNTNEFDKEYYVMGTDGADNHPLLAWGDTSNKPFRKENPIENNEIKLPVEIVFDEPYPLNYEMADLLTLGAQYAVSEILKNLFESKNIFGVQFFPVEIETDKGNTETGHYAMHFWNRMPAIDKDNFDGKIDGIGLVRNLKKFSLDKNLLEKTPIEKRLVIRLDEKPTMLLVHETIYEAIKTEKVTGITFCRVDEWDSSVMFR